MSSTKIHDSGFATSIANSVKRNLKFSFSESTPVGPSNIRKRKSLAQEFNLTKNFSTRKLSDVLELSRETNDSDMYFTPKSDDTSSYGSCFSDSTSCDEIKSCFSQSLTSNSELSFNFGHMEVSSPVCRTQEDYKLSSSLERCSLYDFEKENSLNSAKRYKWDRETPNGRRKSNSAPGTPQHSGNDSDNSIKKYHSLDFTPTKSSYVYTKIGTPESKQILYPHLLERKPATKPKSPQKLRNDLKRLTKPAKKRLFICRDFVYLFSQRSNNREIIHKIFSYLGDGDLCSVTGVSRLWRGALREDRDTYARYRRHSMNLLRSKENLMLGLRPGKGSKGPERLMMTEKENFVNGLPRSPPRTPPHGNFYKFTKLAAGLEASQRLSKCPMCGEPAVLERQIGQCTRRNCQYLWCVGCHSGTRVGPDAFDCRCPTQAPWSPTRGGLGDISNVDAVGSSPQRDCSFLSADGSGLDLSRNTSAAGSSGYFSQSDADKSQNVSKLLRTTAFGECNRRLSGERGRSHDDGREPKSFRSVAELCMKKMRVRKRNSYEPASPPNVKLAVVGSQKSKKNLRRLCL